MGISGLLPLLKSIHKPCNIKKFAGQTVGVDTYGWLHRASVSCALELVLEKPTRRYIDYAMHRVRMLQHFGVTPYLVFDGDNLPSKAATEASRAQRREESRKLGLELHGRGKTAQALQELQKAVDVTPEMARQLIDELRQSGVQYVVAPYEADAQLVYMERKGIISAILSEDSDLLVFGAKCLLTKLDQYGGCVEINQADFCACTEISLSGWSPAEFRRMAILSGCDYLDNIPKMGLKTAYRLVRKHKNVEAIIRAVQFDGQMRVPPGYLEAFRQAELTFLHQRVFCPVEEKLVLHTETEETISEEELPFIGACVEDFIAKGVASGDLHPTTKQPLIVKTGPSRISRMPWTDRSQHTRPTSIGATEGQKGKKPISQFFSQKRAPLAELDPNSFTPSPSQQRVLRQQGVTSWSSSPAPARPIVWNSNTSPATQLTPMQTARITSDTPLHTRPIDVQLPNKRPRLCSDEAEQNLNPGATEIKTRSSPFFASTVPEIDVCQEREGTSETAGPHDIGIFSEDSIDDVIVGLPDFGGRLTKSSKALVEVKIFEDGDTIQAFHDEVDRPDSADYAHIASIGTDPPMKQSFQSSPSPMTRVEPRTGSRAPLRALKKDFSCNPQIAEPVGGRDSSKPKSRIPLAVKLESTPNQALSIHASLRALTGGKVMMIKGASQTPLQRLGVGALRRGRSYQTQQGTTMAQQQARGNTQTQTSSAPRILSTPLRRTTPAAVKAVSVALSPVCVVLHGSEDLMIPDSDEDEDSNASPPRRAANGLFESIDLSTFSFAAPR